MPAGKVAPHNTRTNITISKELKAKLEEMGYDVELPNSYYHPDAEKESWALGKEEHTAFKAKMFKMSQERIKNVDAVLKESGLFLLHYISGIKESEGDAWIKKYIFPGGVIPTLREIIYISAEYNYHTIDVESLRMHYTRTLLEWYKNFQNNKDKVKEMFDEKFIRMWSLYLCSCAAAFNNGVVDLHQILFSKGINNNLPSTRKYLYVKE